MPLRPARCYKELKKPPYTRKEYIDGIPQPKISKFVMGNPYGDFDVVLELRRTNGGRDGLPRICARLKMKWTLVRVTTSISVGVSA